MDLYPAVCLLTKTEAFGRVSDPVVYAYLAKALWFLAPHGHFAGS